MSREALSTSVIQTAEEMLFEEFEATPVPRPEGDFLWARIAIASPLRGSLVVAATETVASELAATLFGEELPDSSLETDLDLLAEFANTVAGSFARKASEDVPLELSPPSKDHGPLPTDFDWTQCAASDRSFFVGLRLAGV